MSFDPCDFADLVIGQLQTAGYQVDTIEPGPSFPPVPGQQPEGVHRVVFQGAIVAERETELGAWADALERALGAREKPAPPSLVATIAAVNRGE